MLNKHQIFAFNDLKEKVVHIWGGELKIRALSVKEQLEYDAFLATEPKEVEMALHLIIAACIDDNGNRLFEETDIPYLKEKNSKNLFHLVHEILSLNKQDDKDVEDLAKNL